MAQVDITGTQHYTQGIGHPKADVVSQPPVEWSDATGTALVKPDGGTATLGGSSGSYTSVENNGSAMQTATNVMAKINAVLTTVVVDPNNWWDNTNKKFLPNKGGNYLVSAALQSQSLSASLQVAIYKNGSSAFVGAFQAPGSTVVSVASGVVMLNGTTDFIELYAYHSVTANVGNSAGNNFINFTYLGPN